MSTQRPPPLELLNTGVPGLDQVLGGGLPEYSFNLLCGAPGSGKTTLIQQLLFANATPERPGLYFTVMGEPALKMLRYQQQMEFFDPDKIGSAVYFVDLSTQAMNGDLGAVLASIERTVKEINPAIVVVDSFRTVVRGQTSASQVQSFVQELALHLASWQITSFLIGEYLEQELQDNPIFTIADSILWLFQHVESNSIVRKLQVMKVRGLGPLPGMHTLRISSAGLRIFPRAGTRVSGRERFLKGQRDGTGIPGFDVLLGGGFPAGDATLVAGPSGTGKTVMSTQFIVEGVQKGDKAVLAIFEEHPEDYVARASRMNFDLQKMIDDGALELITLRPLDLSADEILQQIQDAVMRLDAKRLVIDSINGLEVTLAANFRDEFRESLFRMIYGLTGGGVSMLLTIEVPESFVTVAFSPHAVSFLAQNIVFLRYVELDGELRKMLAVVKMRNSGHSRELHAYEITSTGMRILGPLEQYEGLLTGTPRRRPPADRGVPSGVTAEEAVVLDRLIALQRASPELLAQGMSFAPEAVERAVERLVKLGYAVRTTEDDQVVLRSAPGLRRQ
jgi:circadian clock protein KaiC